jgi:hypothetical protein
MGRLYVGSPLLARRYGSADVRIRRHAVSGAIRRFLCFHLLLMRHGRACKIDGYENTGRETHTEVAEGKTT